jgi:MFS family permease
MESRDSDRPMRAPSAPSQFALLGERRFAPFFWTQFLGAANDNVFKNAFVVFVMFEAASRLAIDAGMIVNLIGAVFILPFMVFSATSGQLADKYEKSRLIRLIKVFEIAIMAIGLVGLVVSSVALLFVALALLGIHSTLFGPVKYAILPQPLAEDELIGGNGLVEMGTFVAILLGTIAGGLAVAIKPDGKIVAGALVVLIAVAGWLASRRIPYTAPVAPQLAINWNPFTETWQNLKLARANIVVWRSMLAISWFWFYGAIYLAQLPAFTQRVLGGNEHVFTLLLALFSIGVGIGSLSCERLSGRRIEPGLVPFGSIGLTLFAVDLWLATRRMAPVVQGGVDAFFTAGANWRVAADIVLLGVFGGFYTVPLYAMIQSRAQASHRSRIIAANNILNALFIIVSAAVAIALLSAGCSIPQLFLVVGVANALVAIGLCALVPEFAARLLAWLAMAPERLRAML